MVKYTSVVEDLDDIMEDSVKIGLRYVFLLKMEKEVFE